jgi:hypothetical protein
MGAEGFDGTAGPCEPWGSVSATNGSNVYRSLSTLTIEIANGGQNFGGCTSFADLVFDQGAWIELAAAPNAAAASAYFVFHLYYSPAGDLGFVVERGELAVLTQNSGPYVEHLRLPHDAKQHRFLRWRPEAGRAVAEVSPDARMWTLLAMSPDPTPSMVRPVIGAGADAVEIDPGRVEIAGYNTCP